MKKIYKFCLLRYHHSLILGEIINIGLLVFLPKESEIGFYGPRNLDRIKKLYENFPEKVISSYYQYFEEKTIELNQSHDMLKKYELDSTLERLACEEYLAADSSIIRFGNFSKSISYSLTYNKILDTLIKTYFPGERFDTALKLEENSNQKKEDWISLDHKNKISKLNINDVFLPSQNDLSFLK